MPEKWHFGAFGMILRYDETWSRTVMSSRESLASVIVVVCLLATVAAIIGVFFLATGRQQGTNAAIFSTAALRGRVLKPSQEVLNRVPPLCEQSTAVRFRDPVLHLFVLPSPRLAIGFR